MALLGVIHKIQVCQLINARFRAERMLKPRRLIKNRKGWSETRKPSQFPDLLFKLSNIKKISILKCVGGGGGSRSHFSLSVKNPKTIINIKNKNSNLPRENQRRKQKITEKKQKEKKKIN